MSRRCHCGHCGQSQHCDHCEHAAHDRHCHKCADQCAGQPGEHGGTGGTGGSGGIGETSGHGGQRGNPNRPGKTVGTGRGRTDDPTPLTKGDLTANNPPDSWAGPRTDLYLPFLFLRANPGDLGGRPVAGPFWESPDVLILAGVGPSLAPPIPPALGQTALAGEPNTVYAHVWNFGHAQAPQVVVEFYWCDPSLGIGPSSTHLIGQTMLSLGARGSGAAHAIVKCPEAWSPTFLNGGHECLLVRAWDFTSDALGTPQWNASLNRHIGQRNIHVVPVGAARTLAMTGAGGASLTARALLTTPLLLKVGPLYGAPAQVVVTRAAPSAMPWLQLRTGVRGQFPSQAVPTGTALLSRAGPVGGGTPTGDSATQQHVTGDDQQLALTTSDAAPGAGEAHVYRVTASQGGQVFGGYTVVLLGA